MKIAHPDDAGEDAIIEIRLYCRMSFILELGPSKDGKGSALALRCTELANAGWSWFNRIVHDRLRHAAYAVMVQTGFGPRNTEGAVILVESGRLGCFAWEAGRHDDTVLLSTRRDATGHELLEAFEVFQRRRKAWGDGKPVEVVE